MKRYTNREIQEGLELACLISLFVLTVVSMGLA